MQTSGQTKGILIPASVLISFFYLGGDVFISALGNLVFFSYSFQISPHPIASLCLGLSVFCIYLFDRSIDSWKEKQGESTDRGSFYKNKLGILFLIGLLVFVSDISLAFLYLPFSFWIGGMFLGLLVGFYFLATQYFRIKYFPKEIFLSLLYTLGIAYPILFESPPEQKSDFLLYLIFYLSILSNVFLTYRHDLSWDESHHLPTMTRFLGKKNTTLLFYLLTGFGFCLSGWYIMEIGKITIPAICLIYSFCYLILMEQIGRKKEIPSFKIFCELVYSPFLLLLLL